ncbi:hypothetical protein [Tabrizicola fusiformis]|uniref:hypothetical protein n=1 Tax=Tabrizicola sp. SY72 TaxID=2741673 RepID=UPI0015718E2C|nr:hypothetical protein [Tabrizicola sp. SY72]NTT88242.1 hypothetical protein [Tabrizicola sp. SY72]
MTQSIPFWTLDGTVDLAALQPENLTADAIGNTLAKINRFGGRTREPWSVAAHSVLVERLCPPDLRPWALLHDAHEAFIGDMTGPAVDLLCLCGTRSAVEHAVANAKGRLDRLIAAAWKTPVRSMNEDIRRADHAALLAEAWSFMGIRPQITDPALRDAVNRAMTQLDLWGATASDWRDAAGLWRKGVERYAGLGLLYPPRTQPDPSSAVLAG